MFSGATCCLLVVVDRSDLKKNNNCNEYWNDFFQFQIFVVVKNPIIKIVVSSRKLQREIEREREKSKGKLKINMKSAPFVYTYNFFRTFSLHIVVVSCRKLPRALYLENELGKCMQQIIFHLINIYKKKSLLFCSFSLFQITKLKLKCHMGSNHGIHAFF